MFDVGSGNNFLLNGNSLEVLKELKENSVDSVVCDPPYELGFMGKKWDNTGIACKQNNFRFVGIELDKEYFEIAKARINKLEVG